MPKLLDDDTIDRLMGAAVAAHNVELIELCDDALDGDLAAREKLTSLMAEASKHAKQRD